MQNTPDTTDTTRTDTVIGGLADSCHLIVAAHASADGDDLIMYADVEYDDHARTEARFYAMELDLLDIGLDRDGAGEPDTVRYQLTAEGVQLSTDGGRIADAGPVRWTVTWQADPELTSRAAAGYERTWTGGHWEGAWSDDAIAALREIADTIEVEAADAYDDERVVDLIVDHDPDVEGTLAALASDARAEFADTVADIIGADAVYIGDGQQALVAALRAALTDRNDGA